MAASSAPQRQSPYSRNQASHPTVRSSGTSREGLPSRGRSPSQPRPHNSVPAPSGLMPGPHVVDRSSAKRERERESAGRAPSSDRPPSQGRSSSKAVLTL